jgi:hypothetical protein
MAQRYRRGVTFLRIFAKSHYSKVLPPSAKLLAMPDNEDDQTSRPKPRHVPVRLPEELYRVLEVARIATGAKSMQAFVSEVVERAVREYADEPEIRAMLQSIGEYQARRDGKLQRMERSTNKGSSRS